MSRRLPWAKFHWDAWETDPALGLCSMGAQGFWMRLLCICAKAEGHLLVGGRKPSATMLAHMTRQSEPDVAGWLDELGRNGVFSRTRGGVIYSRRMRDDLEKQERSREFGKSGGNPALKKQPLVEDGLTPPVKAEEETETEEEKITPQPPVGGRFAEALSIYPREGRVVTAAAKAEPEWVSATAVETEDRLIHAIRGAAAHYAAAPKGPRPPSFQKFLRERRYQAWLPESTQAAAPPLYPPEVLAIVRAAHPRPGYAESYLAAFTWQDLPAPTLTTSSPTMLAKLQPCERELAEIGVRLAFEKRSAA